MNTSHIVKKSPEEKRSFERLVEREVTDLRVEEDSPVGEDDCVAETGAAGVNHSATPLTVCRVPSPRRSGRPPRHDGLRGENPSEMWMSLRAPLSNLISLVCSPSLAAG